MQKSSSEANDCDEHQSEPRTGHTNQGRVLFACMRRETPEPRNTSAQAVGTRNRKTGTTTYSARTGKYAPPSSPPP